MSYNEQGHQREDPGNLNVLPEANKMLRDKVLPSPSWFGFIHYSALASQSGDSMPGTMGLAFIE